MTLVNLGNRPSNAPLPTGIVMRDWGKAEAYAPLSQGLWLSNGVDNLDLGFTPASDCVLVMRASLLITNVGTATWSRADICLRGSQADRAGYVERGNTIHTSHNALTWTTIVLSAIWQLSGGVYFGAGVYVPYVQNYGALYYHQAQRHMNLVGYTLAEGAM